MFIFLVFGVKGVLGVKVVYVVSKVGVCLLGELLCVEYV